MEQVFLCMGVGALLGFLIRKRRVLLIWVERTTLITIFVLLFLMGVAIGNNTEVMYELGNVGITALYITIASVTGSVIVAWFLYRVWSKIGK